MWIWGLPGSAFLQSITERRIPFILFFFRLPNVDLTYWVCTLVLLVLVFLSSSKCRSYILGLHLGTSGACRLLERLDLRFPSLSSNKGWLKFRLWNSKSPKDMIGTLKNSFCFLFRWFLRSELPSHGQVSLLCFSLALCVCWLLIYRTFSSLVLTCTPYG